MDNNNLDIQPTSDMVAEPMAVYGVSHRHHTPTKRAPSRKRIMDTTVSVDEYFDELIRQVHEDYANL